LYYGGHLTHDAAIALSQDMCRVKKILVKYSTDLLLRRVQIRYSSDLAAADEYLRDQLTYRRDKNCSLCMSHVHH